MKMCTSLPYRLESMACVLLLCFSCIAHAEDGYQLWLRYPHLSGALATQLSAHATDYVVSVADSPTLTLATNELERGITGLRGTTISRSAQIHDGSIVLALGNSALLNGSTLSLASLKNDGFLLRALRLQNHDVLVVAATNDRGLLYGVFELLRQLQTNHDLAALNVVSNPALQLRVLDH